MTRGSIPHTTIDSSAQSAHALLESERGAHDAFGRSRRRAYVEIGEYLDRLDAFIDEKGPPLAVTGESGAGKSALAAYWSDRLRKRSPNAFIVVHHVGAAASGRDHVALLRRVMAEIRERYAVADAIPVDHDEIESAFPRWLGHVQREKLVLVIDALDGLDHGSRALGWLPEYLQPQIRLILTTNGGPTLDELRRRGLPELHVQPLTLTERNEVVRRFLGDHMRAFTPEQLRRVSSDAMSANPLFLRTRLEEIGRPGAHERVNETIDHYLEARNLDDLFQRVLARLEGDYGDTLVRAVMTHVWASRRGLRAEELAGIIVDDGDRLASLLSGLEFHLMRREGLLAFYHDHLRHAVRNRYLAASEREPAPEEPTREEPARELHLRIARFFATTPLSPRRAEEEPWQLRQAEAWDALRDCVAALPMFMALAGEETIHQLISYWVAIGERHDMVEAYMTSLARYEESVDRSALPGVLRALGTFLTECGRYDAAESICRRALALGELAIGNSAIGDSTVEPLDRASTLDTLATILYHTSRIPEALEFSRHALDIRERTLGAGHPGVARNLADLGAILYATGSHAEAEELLLRALDLCARHDEIPITAMILNNLGAVRIATGRSAEAIDSIERARAMNARLLGAEHPEVASNLVNLAFALQTGNDHIAAERFYREALWISERALGPRHPQLAVTITNIGALYRRIGRLADAETYFRRALAIRTHALGEDNLETLQSMFRLGTILTLRGKPEEARPLYVQSLEGMVKLLPDDDPALLRMREFAAADFNAS